MENKTFLLNNPELEQKVISSILSFHGLYEDTQDSLSLDLFTDYDCRRVYKAIEEQVKEGKVPDIVEVGYIITQNGGDMGKFLISDPISSVIILRQYIDTLRDLLIRRKLLEVCYKGMSIVNDPTAETDDVNKVIRDFDNVLMGKEENIQSYDEAVSNLQATVASRMNGGEAMGMATGFRLFDRHFGFHDGDLIIMAGETSQGKTTLAVTIAKNMAKAGIPIVFYSLEMSVLQLTARISAGEAMVVSSDLLYQKLTDEQYNRFYDTTTRMKSLPIYFDEKSKTTFTGICRSIRRMVKKYNVKVVFIDYLQILANGGRLDGREQMLGDMARDLKRLASELNICIVALSQMSRQQGKDKNSQPTISRLRGSGQIEEAADMVVLIHRPDLEKERTTVYIAKGRNTGIDKDNIKFNAMFSYFSDYEEGDPQKPYEEHKEVLPF